MLNCIPFIELRFDGTRPSAKPVAAAIAAAEDVTAWPADDLRGGVLQDAFRRPVPEQNLPLRAAYPDTIGRVLEKRCEVRSPVHGHGILCSHKGAVQVSSKRPSRDWGVEGIAWRPIRLAPLPGFGPDGPS